MNTYESAQNEPESTFFNKDYYPTPRALATRMLNKVDFTKVKTVLEPSAGKGDLIDAIECYRESHHYHHFDVSAIEINPTLCATLLGKEFSVIDNDFLTYTGVTHFDLIVANFPFSEGEKHLTKALDILFCGQIVCLINAETLKNPYTNARKVLISRLEKYSADIEYLKNTFVDAERSTSVEVALVYVNIERSVEVDIFGGLDDAAEEDLEALTTLNELETHNHYKNLVASYNRTQTQVTDHLVNFYKNYSSVSTYLTLSVNNKKIDQYERDEMNLTQIMRKQHNQFIKKLKNDYWRKVTHLPTVGKYLTHGQRECLRANMDTFHCKEFTERNIRQFVLNLVDTFPEHIYKAIDTLFETMTEYALRDNRWGNNEYKANIHYFNAWKTNNAYKVNKRVILPYYGDAFRSYRNSLGWQEEKFLEDIEKVMLYFTDFDCTATDIVSVCNEQISRGNTRKIDTRFFYVSVFKKGTLHIQFKDEDLLRKFNIEACKRKGFLPMDYGDKDISELNEDRKNIVVEFEGIAEYKIGTNNVAFTTSTHLPTLLTYDDNLL